MLMNVEMYGDGPPPRNAWPYVKNDKTMKMFDKQAV